ncbi:MAG TPA: hypothetical protein VFE61_01870 [Candidatus Sulfotelmatobacter sp.]|nr:hypothetical protein [Candidatus Sulfotelmatobacter sp.]
MTHTPRKTLLLISFALAISSISVSQTATTDSKTIPVLDGDAGPCSADFTITDASGAPVYAAKIKVHIAYRFGGFHKLDLEVSTNADGKARVTGLPDRVKRDGLTFNASEGDRTGEAFDDPGKTCQAQFTIALKKADQKKSQ